MTDRRDFMKQAGAFAGTLALSSFIPSAFARELEIQTGKISGKTPDESASDEDFWNWVRESYTVSPNIMNLNNGGVSPQPKIVQDAHIRYYQMCNEGPSYYMWQILDQGREPLREKLAELAGVSPEEVAINRNSTESLNTIIFGLNLKAGDEIVLTKQDYPNMQNAWRQREKRDGIKLVWINMELPIEDSKAIVKLYEEAITDRTKLIHVTHIINWTGQIMPAKELAKMAHSKGIDVLLDGAHSFGHFNYDLKDLDCDYWGTSLHKWLCAPFGTGMLYVKKDHISRIWPLLCNDKPESDDIRKFETLGTRSFAAEMAISEAIDFHNAIGIKRKEARLRYLKNYWCEKALKIPGVKLNTSLNDEFSCAIANFTIGGMKPEEVSGALFTKYKIHTVGINYENIHGVRVTPHVYTSTKDLDKLVRAIEEIAKTQTAK